jgi:hypothetical protein
METNIRNFSLIAFFSFMFSSTLGNMCHANDSLMSVTSSGLEYEKSNQISMESEDLYISLSKIKVKYLFKNHTKTAVKAVMAFPFPRLDLSPGANYEVNICADDPSKRADETCTLKNDPFQFELTINGKRHSVKSEVKYDKMNYSANLKYYWEQTFPPGEQVSIEHLYRVVAGGNPENEPDKYCIDESFKMAAEKKDKVFQSKSNTATYGNYRNVAYILKTGANWKGPIRNFKLRIDKESSNNLVSLCWQGLKKINATTFEFSKTNYVPDQDLAILFRTERRKPVNPIPNSSAQNP